MNSVKHALCPCCDDKAIAKLGNLQYGPECIFSTTPIKLDFVPELWQCNKCQSKFTQNIMPEDKIDSLYSKADSATRWSNTPFEKRQTDELISLMREHLSKGKRLLDVGCNTGEFLDFAKSLDFETFGVELSTQCIEILLQKGHQAHQAIDQVNGEVDIITAFDLIEHIQHPNKFIAECYDKLALGGLMIIATGNPNSKTANHCGSSWWYAQYPEHIVFPSPNFLLNKNSFKDGKIFAIFPSRPYKVSRVYSAISRLWKTLRGKYIGLPTMGPDHMLVILKK